MLKKSLRRDKVALVTKDDSKDVNGMSLIDAILEK